MEYKPVELQIVILRLLYEENVSVNNVFLRVSEQTGLKYKLKLINTIKELQKNGLIARKNSPKHKQVKLLFLTQTGRTIVKFTKDIEYFLNSYRDFIVKKNQNYPFDNEKLTDELRSKLSNRKWQKNEKDSYIALSQRANNFAHESGILFLTAILGRYIKLLLNQHHNRCALELIIKIFEDGTYEHVGKNLTTLFSKNDANENEIMENILGNLGKNISQFVWKYSLNTLGPNKSLGRDIKFLETEIDSVRDCIYSLYRN